MNPEIINWEAVRCITIDGTIVRLIGNGVEHEIAFPSMDALNAALSQWALHPAASGDRSGNDDSPVIWPQFVPSP